MTGSAPASPELAVVVDLSSPVPPYEQIRAQVSGHVATGALRAGDRLPTVRALAADLGIATNTVGRAYRELELAGLVVSRRRSGTVVSGAPPGPGTRAQRSATQDAAELLVRVGRAAGMSEEEVLDLVRGTLIATRPGAAQSSEQPTSTGSGTSVTP